MELRSLVLGASALTCLLSPEDHLVRETLQRNVRLSHNLNSMETQRPEICSRDGPTCVQMIKEHPLVSPAWEDAVSWCAPVEKRSDFLE